MKQVNREDVAREAGVSVATVSYVINDGPRPIAPATRERVLAAIEKVGYKPNILARALAGGQSNTYGFVAPNITTPSSGKSLTRCRHTRRSEASWFFRGLGG